MFYVNICIFQQTTAEFGLDLIFLSKSGVSFAKSKLGTSA